MRHEYRVKYTPTQMLHRLTQNELGDAANEPVDMPFAFDDDNRGLFRVRAFYKMATHRKRQILERMLSDWTHHE